MVAENCMGNPREESLRRASTPADPSLERISSADTCFRRLVTNLSVVVKDAKELEIHLPD